MAGLIPAFPLTICLGTVQQLQRKVSKAPSFHCRSYGKIPLCRELQGEGGGVGVWYELVPLFSSATVRMTGATLNGWTDRLKAFIFVVIHSSLQALSQHKVSPFFAFSCLSRLMWSWDTTSQDQQLDTPKWLLCQQRALLYGYLAKL